MKTKRVSISRLRKLGLIKYGLKDKMSDNVVEVSTGKYIVKIYALQTVFGQIYLRATVKEILQK